MLLTEDDSAIKVAYKITSQGLASYKKSLHLSFEQQILKGFVFISTEFLLCLKKKQKKYYCDKDLINSNFFQTKLSPITESKLFFIL